jgi:protease-4
MGYPPYAVPQKKKKRVWPIVLAGVIGFFLLFFIVIAAIAGSSSYKGGAPSLDTDYVAVIHIASTIEGDYVTTQKYGSYGTHKQVFLIDTIYDLVNDSYNCGIMLYINSPGGEVTATDELGRAIEYYKETTKRPVYAYFADYATSGAYWIGSYADVITAHKYCITGSIGVSYGSHLDLSGLLEKLGIKVTNLTAGENKAMGSEYEPLTEEQLKIYQEQLDEMHDSFIELVCNNRGLKEADVRKIADGRTMLASKALEHGLVDGIGYYSDAQSKMIEDCGFDEGIVFYDCLDPEVVSFSVSSYVKALDEKAKAESSTDEEALAELLSDLSRNRKFLVIYNY